jgi:hypothetical protein
MKVSPALRRAVHLAADLVLDALSADEDAPAKPKRRRGPCVPPLPAASVLSPELAASVLSPELEKQLERQLRKAGFKPR